MRNKPIGSARLFLTRGSITARKCSLTVSLVLQCTPANSMNSSCLTEHGRAFSSETEPAWARAEPSQVSQLFSIFLLGTVPTKAYLDFYCVSSLLDPDLAQNRKPNPDHYLTLSMDLLTLSVCIAG
jgi:hypothetical protein